MTAEAVGEAGPVLLAGEVAAFLAGHQLDGERQRRADADLTDARSQDRQTGGDVDVVAETETGAGLAELALERGRMSYEWKGSVAQRA